MYTIEASSKFRKDYKLCLKRGLEEQRMDEVIMLPEKDGSLPAKYKPHKLKGKLHGFVGVSYPTGLVVDLVSRR